MGSDPKSLWKDQDRESDPVSLDQIHGMLRRYDQRAQRAAIVIPAILLVVGIEGGVTWMKAHDWVGQVLAVALVLGEATTFYLARRMLFEPRDPAEPAGVYLHRRLLRRLDYLKGRWLIAAAPLLPAMLMAQWVALGHSERPLWLRLSPSLIIVACVVFVRVMGRNRKRRVLALIEELETLMGR
jgi:hypothetical protein